MQVIHSTLCPCARSPVGFFLPPLLGCSLDLCAMCFVVCGYKSGSDRVGQQCPQRDLTSFCLSSERDSANPKLNAQPKLIVTERTEPQLNPEGDWTLAVVRGHTFTCNTAPI